MRESAMARALAVVGKIWALPNTVIGPGDWHGPLNSLEAGPHDEKPRVWK